MLYKVRTKNAKAFRRAGVFFDSEFREYELTDAQAGAVLAEPNLIVKGAPKESPPVSDACPHCGHSKKAEAALVEALRSLQETVSAPAEKAPKAEEAPKGAEAPKAEEPKAEEPAKGPEAPKAEKPKAEAPKAPKAEAK